jgi:pimeloyl-ACP methyl ester carboxylesterase
MNFVTRDFPGAPALRVGEGPDHGPPLVLLHGVTRGWRDWEPLLPALSAEWHVFALDQRGHGGSGRASSYLVTDYVADVVRFVGTQTTGRCCILGHSLGAMVAAGVAAEIPEMVCGIALEDPPFHTMGNRIAVGAWRAQFVGMQEAATRGLGLEELTDTLADISLPTSTGETIRLGELRDRSSLHWSAQCLMQLDPEVLSPIIAGRWLDGYDVTQVFSRVHCPVLLLQGDPLAGGALTDADAAEAAELLPSCRQVRFPGVGHQLHRERPHAVLEALQEFATALGESNAESAEPIP